MVILVQRETLSQNKQKRVTEEVSQRPPLVSTLTCAPTPDTQIHTKINKYTDVHTHVCVYIYLYLHIHFVNSFVNSQLLRYSNTSNTSAPLRPIEAQAIITFESCDTI